MQVYKKGGNCTHIYIYMICFNLQSNVSSSYNLYSLDQPANNGFVIVQSIGYSSLRGTNMILAVYSGKRKNNNEKYEENLSGSKNRSPVTFVQAFLNKW